MPTLVYVSDILPGDVLEGFTVASVTEEPRQQPNMRRMFRVSFERHSDRATPGPIRMPGDHMYRVTRADA